MRFVGKKNGVVLFPRGATPSPVQLNNLIKGGERLQ